MAAAGRSPSTARRTSQTLVHPAVADQTSRIVCGTCRASAPSRRMMRRRSAFKSSVLGLAGASARRTNGTIVLRTARASGRWNRSLTGSIAFLLVPSTELSGTERMNRPRSEPVTPERAVVISALLIACCAAVFQTSRVAAAPPASSVQTNRSEYQPNDTVIVTGCGWQPGAPITLTFHEMLEKPLHADVVISTFADDGGVIDTSRLNTPDDDFQPDAHDRGLTYQLTATGY